MKEFKALVTGGSKGIGQAIVELLGENGCEVIKPTRDELDLSDVGSVKSYIKCQEFNFDILINNAGVNPISKFDEISEEEWDQTLMVNLKAPMLLAQACIPYMKKKEWGRIVNISSTFSKVTKAMRGPYTSSKSGLDGLTRTMAVELGSSNILVNSVCPGFVMTDLTRQNNSDEQIKEFEKLIPVGRLAAPAEIAEFVFFLSSPKNSYITGQALSIDGGFICQ